jgi:plasmid stabilization system protein ParE
VGRRLSRKRPIRWSRLADLDLQAAYTYLSERNPSAARRLAADILQALEHIKAHPEAGSVALDLFPHGRYRHWICGNYRIIFRIDDDWIRLLRIWDSRRNPADLKPE